MEQPVASVGDLSGARPALLGVVGDVDRYLTQMSMRGRTSEDLRADVAARSQGALILTRDVCGQLLRSVARARAALLAAPHERADLVQSWSLREHLARELGGMGALNARLDGLLDAALPDVRKSIHNASKGRVRLTEHQARTLLSGHRWAVLHAYDLSVRPLPAAGPGRIPVRTSPVSAPKRPALPPRGVAPRTRSKGQSTRLWHAEMAKEISTALHRSSVEAVIDAFEFTKSWERAAARLHETGAPRFLADDLREFARMSGYRGRPTKQSTPVPRRRKQRRARPTVGRYEVFGGPSGDVSSGFWSAVRHQKGGAHIVSGGLPSLGHQH